MYRYDSIIYFHFTVNMHGNLHKKREKTTSHKDLNQHH